MSKTLLTLFLIIFGSTMLISQNNVTFSIHHKLNDVDFSMNTGSQNNLENDFNVSRMEYYISEISLFHDGGVETTISDLWILVDASETTEIDLGVYDFSIVEKMAFSIGVDEEHNHLDPSSYDAEHPLAPQSPSMHWGWTPGYRFIAMEGQGGSVFDKVFQLHTVGDENYFRQEIELNQESSQNEIEIHIDADYSKALENIKVDKGVIVHGEDLEANMIAQNFRDHVFTKTTIIDNTLGLDEGLRFEIYPNPSLDGNILISMDSYDENGYDVAIVDVLGRRIAYYSDVKEGLNIQLDSKGCFFVRLLKNGRIISHQTLMAN